MTPLSKMNRRDDILGPTKSGGQSLGRAGVDAGHVAQEDEHATGVVQRRAGRLGERHAHAGNRIVHRDDDETVGLGQTPRNHVHGVADLWVRPYRHEHPADGRPKRRGQGAGDQRPPIQHGGQLPAAKPLASSGGQDDRIPWARIPLRHRSQRLFLITDMTPYDDSPAQAVSTAPRTPASSLIDGFGRAVTYLRVSVTDRCDLRCVYCMAEHMTFLPKAEVLTLEELDRVVSAFVGLGVRKLRLTGGEPLVRKGFMGLVESLSRHLRSGALDELTLTTNGTQLAPHAAELARHGVRRINVSLDTLKPDLFRALTRGGDVAQVVAGIDAALKAGLQVKINTVALKHDNAREIPDLIRWAHARGCDLTLIETMPLGEVDQDRTDQFLSLVDVRRDLASFWTLNDISDATGGPARYVRIAETGGRLGLITPLSNHFCDTCNRVRLTCTGTLHTCLGRDDARDLRAVIRSGASDVELTEAIFAALESKPKGHDFQIAAPRPAVARHMSTTGG